MSHCYVLQDPEVLDFEADIKEQFISRLNFEASAENVKLRWENDYASFTFDASDYPEGEKLYGCCPFFVATEQGYALWDIRIPGFGSLKDIPVHKEETFKEENRIDENYLKTYFSAVCDDNIKTLQKTAQYALQNGYGWFDVKEVVGKDDLPFYQVEILKGVLIKKGFRNAWYWKGKIYLKM